jgi:DNA-binding NtrC family response regulator/tetratricopeptide (TPR) repeat protein
VRYKLVKHLGKGAQGSVDLAEDRFLNGRLVAVKTLRSRAAEQWQSAFRHEFEVLAGLQHPRLSAVHDFGQLPDGRIFFSRDYLPGQDLKSGTAGMSAGEIALIGIEVCRALEPLHQRGLIHGDLKPGNIVLGPDGIVRLIDFSFVRSATDVSADSYSSGTVQYMAPEVIEERLADVRADLYSLGATLFEIVAGAPPFDGTVGEVIAGHLGEERPELVPARVEPGREADSDLIAGLVKIVARLLRREPDERFPDIGELEAALTALVGDRLTPDPIPHIPVLPVSAGRDKELRRIREAVSARLDSPGEHPVMLVVEGAFGTGKRTIRRCIKWRSQLDGVPVIEARCEGGGGFLDPIASLVEQALAVLEGDEAELARGTSLLETMARPGTGTPGLEGLAVDAGRLLARAASRGRMLIAIDDVDRATRETLRLIRGIAASIGPEDRTALLVTAETGFPWREQLGQATGFVLPVLGREQVAQLVKAFFGRVDDETVDRLLAHTGGNPLFVSTLLADLAASGEGLERLERLGAPRPLEAYWRDRLGGLSREERSAVECAAVLGRPIEVEELSEMQGSDPSDAWRVLDVLQAAGWVRRGPDGWRLATPPVAREVIGAAGAERIVELHRSAMELESDPARRLLHAAECGEAELVISEGLEVAEGLERVGALDAAREVLEATDRYRSDDQAVERLALGRVSLAQGDYKAARPQLESLCESADTTLRRKGLLLLGRLHGLVREPEEAAARLTEALDLPGDSSDTARILLELANVLFRAGEAERAASTAEAGLDETSESHPARADLLGVLGKLAAFAGRHDEALARCREAVRVARASGDRRTLALAIDMLAWVRQQSGDLRGAAEELTQAVALHKEIGDLPRLARALRVLGDVEWWLERWFDALGHYEEADRLSGAVGNPAQRIEARISLGQALVKVGRFERAALVLAGAREEATLLGHEESRLKVLVYEGDLAAVQGRPERALELWSEARAGLEKMGLKAVATELELEMAEVRLWRRAAGDLEEAAALIERAARQDREDLGRGLEEMLALQRAVLKLAEGSFEEAMRDLDRLADELGRDGPRDLLWQVHLAAARSLVERGLEVLGRKRLREAEQILDHLASGLPSEHRLAFWQDVRRAEVRRLLAITVPSSSGLPVSDLTSSAAGAQLDPEARSLYRVLEFNKQLSSEPELGRLLEAILDAAVELTGAERGFLLMPGPDGLDAHAAREIGCGDARDPHEQFSRSIAESVLLDGEAVVTVDAAGDERFNEFISIHELKIRSVACVPVTYRGKALGVLYLENRLRRGRFGGRDLRVLSAFSDQVAIAITQAKLLEEAKSRQSELEDATRALEAVCARQEEDLKATGADLELAQQRVERIRRRIEGQGDYRGVIGSGPAMAQVFELVERVKDLDVPVVFVGESGTGKDLLARVLHDSGSRSTGPFVAISCGGVPDTLVEATLFGHTKGAFSGADSERPGLFATASSGSLYLDDIGEMPPRMQVDLLRVLQEGSYSPLGGQQSYRTDFRLIASSKEPLQDLVASGRLRSDLYYRLQVLSIDLPPLREHAEDVPALAHRIVARESGRLDIPKREITGDAIAALCAHEWPGNVRELEQTIRRALVVGDPDEALTPHSIFGGSAPAGEAATPRRGRRSTVLGSEEERKIVEALEQCQWNRSRAAKLLGIPRRTFYRRLEKLGLIKKKS